jgi:DoxX-like family
VSRKIVYWVCTSIIGVALLASISYLSGTEQMVSGFEQAGYPQHLRIVLGIVKPIAGLVLLAPGIPLVKEWAYTGAAITWIMAAISAYETAGPWFAPLGLLALLVVSYLTRPAGRRLTGVPAGA